MSSANSDSFTSLPIFIPFISLSCLMAVSNDSRTILNRSGHRGHLCLVPDLRVKDFSFSHLELSDILHKLVTPYFYDSNHSALLRKIKI